MEYYSFRKQVFQKQKMRTCPKDTGANLKEFPVAKVVLDQNPKNKMSIIHKSKLMTITD